MSHRNPRNFPILTNRWSQMSHCCLTSHLSPKIRWNPSFRWSRTTSRPILTNHSSWMSRRYRMSQWNPLNRSTQTCPLSLTIRSTPMYLLNLIRLLS